MKKILLLLVILCLVGCGKNTDSKNDDLKDKFLKYAKDYYEKYSVKGFNEVNVSLDSLKQANEKTKSNYDLSIFSKCDNSSYIKLIINTANQKVDKVEYFLNCK
jgi:uncharacterized protein YxeA